MTSEVLIDTFKEIEQTEKQFIRIYEEMAREVKSEELKKTLEGIRDDEIKHAKNAQEIIRILETHQASSDSPE